MSDINIDSKVSIIMPTYNRAGLIMETIESICSQTYSNWELIIMDDGSDDNTEELVTRLKDERIHFYKAGRIGVGGKIKNMGLEKASDKLIAFIDSDDLWSATKLEKQVVALQQYPEAGFCITGGYNFKKHGEPVDHFYKQREGMRYDNVFIDCFQSGVAGYTQALMFRKECIEVTGNFKETGSFSDSEFIIRLAHQFKAVILYEPLVFRRLHNENYIHANWEKSYYEGLGIIQFYKMNKLLPSKIVRDAIFRLYINWGEKYLGYKKRRKAIRSFFDAWKQKPFSVIPFKKTVKAIIYSLEK